jgi:predicted nucleotidyltransferase
MSLPSLPTPTINCSLDEVIVRLRQHAAVDGILVMGSAADDRLTPHSDYDLLLVLDPMPVPLHLIFTQIGRRLTEIYVATPAAIERVTGGDAPRDGSYEATLVGWLQIGTIRFDRHGRLGAAEARAQRESAIRPQGERGVYGAWFNVNYNLQQTRRILQAGDPASLISVDLRLLHTIHALWLDYFLIRRLAGRSEKDQIRYLQAHDPSTLRSSSASWLSRIAIAKWRSTSSLRGSPSRRSASCCPQMRRCCTPTTQRRGVLPRSSAASVSGRN